MLKSYFTGTLCSGGRVSVNVLLVRKCIIFLTLMLPQLSGIQDQVWILRQLPNVTKTDVFNIVQR